MLQRGREGLSAVFELAGATAADKYIHRNLKSRQAAASAISLNVPGNCYDGQPGSICSNARRHHRPPMDDRVDGRRLMVYSNGMKATTIKLEGSMLKALREFKRPGQTLTSLVCELLNAQIHRQKMARAAEEYTVFLRQNPEESLELDVWASVS